MSVRPQGRYQQEDRHSRKEEGARPEVIILVLEEKVQNRHRDIAKPEEVGDDKQFTKRNVVVQRHVDLVVVAGHRLFQVRKPQKIDDGVHDHRDHMLVFMIKCKKTMFFFQCLGIQNITSLLKTNQRLLYFIPVIIADKNKKSKYVFHNFFLIFLKKIAIMSRKEHNG